jgi:hypothetical protein
MTDNNIIIEVSKPIFDARNWMKFIGILAIISGVTAIFSLVGILICWLPIWMGILLFQSGSRIEKAFEEGSKDDLVDSLLRLKKYFVITGVISLISIAFAFIMVMFAGGAIFSQFVDFPY